MGEQTTLTGTISRIRFQSPDLRFTVGQLTNDAFEDIPFKFNGAVSLNDRVTFTGVFETDPKWGEQFVAKRVNYNLPIDPDGLMRYLVECPDFKGLGMHKAALLVAALGVADFDAEVRKAKPEALASAAKLSADDAKAFQTAWKKRSAVNELSTHLASFELTNSQITKVIDALGDEALPVLKANPYRLTEVEGFGFKTVDKIALRIGIEKNDSRRLGAGLSAALGAAMSQGHTWSPRDILFGDASTVLVLDGLVEEVDATINGAIDKELEAGTLIEDEEGRVALAWVRHAETIIHEKLWFVRNHNSHDRIDQAHREHALEFLELDTLWIEANAAQREAVKAVLTNLALVLTGVAGTGKTTVVKLIIRALNLAGVHEIALCAPTGKASRRLEQVCGRPAQTVHRLLGAGPKGFEVDEVQAQVVIVDEASMMDSVLLSSLLKRLRYGTCLVLVGDVNQLPPVGPGNPLRDIINKKLCPVVALTEVVRQAGRLQRNALAILGGRVAENEASEAADKAWFLVQTRTKDKNDKADPRSDAEIARDALVKLVESHIERLGYDPVYELQVVTAQEPGALGTTALNVALQKLLQHRRGVEAAPLAENERPKFYVGDKVIFLKNEPELGLLNGDAGIVRALNHRLKDGRLEGVVVSWDCAGEEDNHRLITVPRASLSDLSLGYALTVHKAQGSEYPCVLVVAHKAHSHLHRSSGRNWLYTAVTRARKTCLLFGDSWGLRNAAAHVSEDKRRTWLALEEVVSDVL